MAPSGYFDYAAATPVDGSVLAAMQPFFADQFYNPSADYEPARSVRVALESARSQVAQVIGAKPVEIIFTAGGTEANNIAVHGVMRNLPNANMIMSSIEHDSIRGPAAKYNNKECPVNEKGIVDVELLKSLIDDKTALVSIMLANNEIGTVQPIREIGRIIEQIRKQRVLAGNELPLLLHTDAAQAGNYLDVHVHRLGVDLMTINGGKLYGPKQSGALYVRGGTVLTPLTQGGGQERNLRSGTEHVAASVGFSCALEATQKMRAQEVKRMSALQNHFIHLLKTHVPSAIINGSLKYRLPNNLHITLTRQDNERLLILLDQADIFAAVGSACSASHDEPSHVLGALGKTAQEIRGSLRFSMGRGTSEADIDHLVATLAQIIA